MRSLPPGIFFVRNILSGGAFSLCETSFRAGFFLVCAGLSLVRGSFRAGFLSCGIFFRAKYSLGRGFFSMRDILPCGIFSCLCGAFPCAGFLPCGVLFRAGLFLVRGFFRAGFSSATRTGAIAGRVPACSGPRPLFPAPVGRAPRRAFPCLSACRWALPGAFFRMLRACGCPRRTVVPRSVFDSLLKSPGPVLGIPPNFSYLWMQKMSFAALKTYRTE